MISVVKLKRLVKLQIRGSGEDFDYVFYTSVNDVVSDIIVETVLDVEAIDEDDPPAEIDLDVKYFRVFLEGVVYYMQKNAMWARKSEEISRIDYDRAKAQAQMEAIEDADSPVGFDYEDE